MAGHSDFLAQLENLRHEAYVAAQYLYSDMAVQYAASKSPTLLSRLNMTPSFWLTHRAGMQVAAYMTISRVFDTKSKYNIDALLNSFEANLREFSRDALASRKREGQRTDPEWLAGYLEGAHYPDKRDVARLREKVTKYRQICAVKPPRHKYIAHREKRENSDVQELFAAGKVSELLRLVTFLYAMYCALWEQYHNGRKPRLRSRRYSVRTIYEAKSSGCGGPHEVIIAEIRKLMEFMEQVTPNSFEDSAGASQ